MDHSRKLKPKKVRQGGGRTQFIERGFVECGGSVEGGPADPLEKLAHRGSAGRSRMKCQTGKQSREAKLLFWIVGRANTDDGDDADHRQAVVFLNHNPQAAGQAKIAHMEVKRPNAWIAQSREAPAMRAGEKKRCTEHCAGPKPYVISESAIHCSSSVAHGRGSVSSTHTARPTATAKRRCLSRMNHHVDSPLFARALDEKPRMRSGSTI